jgi:hypothetical protein
LSPFGQVFDPIREVLKVVMWQKTQSNAEVAGHFGCRDCMTDQLFCHSGARQLVTAGVSKHGHLYCRHDVDVLASMLETEGAMLYLADQLLKDQSLVVGDGPGGQRNAE